MSGILFSPVKEGNATCATTGMNPEDAALSELLTKPVTNTVIHLSEDAHIWSLTKQVLGKHQYAQNE
jgi:hypothetical protein